MRLAHLFPEKKAAPVEFATHHELHLREEEARDLTVELLSIEHLQRYPLLEKVLAMLANRNASGPKREPLPAAVTYSYPSGRSTTLAEVRGANAEKARGETVKWVNVTPPPQAAAKAPFNWPSRILSRSGH